MQQNSVRPTLFWIIITSFGGRIIPGQDYDFFLGLAFDFSSALGDLDAFLEVLSPTLWVRFHCDMPKAVELPDHVPDHARCAYCASTHSTSLSDRGQIVINVSSARLNTFVDTHISQCGARGELARWNVQSKTFVVPLKHLGSVEIARPARVPPSPQRAGRLLGGGRQNALHDLLQRNDAHPRGVLGDRPGTVRLVFTNLDVCPSFCLRVLSTDVPRAECRT